MKPVPVLFFFLFFLFLTGTGSIDEKKTYTIVFYNAENLFDIYDDPEKNDDAFTPGGKKQWDREKYRTKLVNISKVLSSIDKNNLPEIIGLCEVENAEVLRDLTGTRGLKKGDYEFIHEESPDERGIDLAFLYRKDVFSYAGHEVLPVVFPFDSSASTRNILHVTGTLNDHNTCHFFLNHWSSRREGIRQTRPKRICASVTLRKSVDRILSDDPSSRIIIMGDFNDEPTNRSIFEILRANNKRKNTTARELYNLMYDMHNTGNVGSYNYRGRWYMYDQIIVSQNLVTNRNGYGAGFNSGKIFMEKWMLYRNQNLGQDLPSRTYSGNTYHGGYSDHLPVYIILEQKPE